MDQFSTQYMPSNVGLVRAVPLMQRKLKTGAGIFVLTYFLVGFVLFFTAGFAERYFAQLRPAPPSWASFLVALGIFALVSWGVLTPWMRGRAARRLDQLLPPTMTRLAADEGGVTISDEQSHGHWDWQHIRGAIETPGGMTILMGYGGMFVPDTAFHSVAERTDVVALINRRANRTAL